MGLTTLGGSNYGSGIGRGANKGAYSHGIEGMEQLDKLLKDLPLMIVRKYANQAFKRGTASVVAEAKKNAPVSSGKDYIDVYAHNGRNGITTKSVRRRSGMLRRSIKFVPWKRSIGGFVGPDTGNKTKANDAWYAHMVEFGTKGYTVKKDKFVPGVGLVKAGTRIKGQKPVGFMRRAWDSKRLETFRNIEKELFAMVQGFINRNKPKAA